MCCFSLWKTAELGKKILKKVLKSKKSFLKQRENIFENWEKYSEDFIGYAEKVEKYFFRKNFFAVSKKTKNREDAKKSPG